MPPQTNRIALVTGGGRGIGRSIAIALAEDGADVAISYVRDEEAAAETVAALQALGVRALACRAAVHESADCESLVEKVSSDLGSIDILVNNAGIASRRNKVEDTDPAELEKVIRIHALGPHRLCQLVLPQMKQRERGDIVMISSSATLSMMG